MKNLKRVFALLLVFMLLITTSITASAEDGVTYDGSNYNNYTYWGKSSSKSAHASKPVYDAEKVVELSNMGVDFQSMALEQVAFDHLGNISILDGASGSIIVLNRNYEYVETITEVYKGSEVLKFKGAQGIYYDQNGHLYIADTENNRVLNVVNKQVVDIITKPTSTIVPEDLVFKPLKYITDERGFGYLLCDGCYYGLMVFTPEKEFLGFFGANIVPSTFFDALTEMITGIFDSATKHEGSVKKLPYLLSDITMTSSGYVCAVNNEASGQLRLFAPTGDNILRYTDGFTNGGGDSLNFGDQPSSFMDLADPWGNSFHQNFVATASDDMGYIYALDSLHGRVYMYDEECNSISVFGGGRREGNQLGTFASAISLDIYGDELVVLDFLNKNITVFKVTEFGKQLMTAQQLTLDGDYEKAYTYWQDIYNQDKNVRLAHLGLAKYHLNRSEYDLAMEYARTGNDKYVYSQAYSQVLDQYTRENFWWIALLIIVILIAFFVIRHILKKRGFKMDVNPKLKNCSRLLLHPIDCFNNIRNYNKGSVKIATIILILYYVARISETLFTSFMYNNVNMVTFNSIFVMFGSVGLLLLYVIVNWAACVLFEGKGKLKEIYISSCYCLIPLILSSVIYTVLSYFMIPSANSAISLVSTIFTLFFAVYLLLSITVIHDFSFFKAIAMMIVIIVGIAIVIFIIFAVLMLTQDLVGFVVSVFNEFTLR